MACHWPTPSIRIISSWRLGFHYARSLAEHTLVDIYVAPVGDPALGPVAFPHRASAAELPEAPISHHWQDSTHIADDVVTLGVAHKKIRLEASGFHGAEPGENRWIMQSGAIDSWSARLWFFPSAELGGASFGRQTGASGSSGTWRPGALHRVARVQPADGWRRLVVNRDLGA